MSFNNQLSSNLVQNNGLLTKLHKRTDLIEKKLDKLDKKMDLLEKKLEELMNAWKYRPGGMEYERALESFNNNIIDQNV